MKAPGPATIAVAGNGQPLPPASSYAPSSLGCS